MTGPLPNILLPITVPLSWGYRGIVAARNRRFDQGIGVMRFDVPVISVGNITTGGTGKTPMVAWIAKLLLEHEVMPVIAMRGYKSRPGEMSDEQVEYLELLPDVPVVANADRIAQLREFLPANQKVECVILDDGFQHRQIHRDLDLALIDATAATFEDRLLPAGHLREPLANLKRADAVIVTRAEAQSPPPGNSNLKSQINSFHGRAALAWSRHRWTRLDEIHGDNVHFSREPDWLRGKRVTTMLGVGNPAAVKRQIESFGATIIADVAVSDHQHYEVEIVDEIERVMDMEDAREARTAESETRGGVDALIVTGKDWVKLRRVIDWSRWTVPIVVPRLEIEVFEGEAALREWVLAAARARTAGKPAR